jgi:hypothetical protein
MKTTYIEFLEIFDQATCLMNHISTFEHTFPFEDFNEMHEAHKNLPLFKDSRGWSHNQKVIFWNYTLMLLSFKDAERKCLREQGSNLNREPKSCNRESILYFNT